MTSSRVWNIGYLLHQSGPEFRLHVSSIQVLSIIPSLTGRYKNCYRKRINRYTDKPPIKNIWLTIELKDQMVPHHLLSLKSSKITVRSFMSFQIKLEYFVSNSSSFCFKSCGIINIMTRSNNFDPFMVDFVYNLFVNREGSMYKGTENLFLSFDVRGLISIFVAVFELP